MVVGDEEIAPPSRDRALVELAHGLIEAVADLIKTNGYLALSGLERRLDDLRGTLSDEAYTLKLEVGAHTAKLRQLQPLIGDSSGDEDGEGSRLPHDAVIISERRLREVEEHPVGEHLLDGIRSMEWGLWTDDGAPQYEVEALVIGTRNEESLHWEPELDGDYTRAPVPLSEWVRDQLEVLGADPDQPRSLGATIDEVQRRARERRASLDKRLDVVELRLAVIRAVKEEVERFGADPHALLALTSDTGAIELAEAVDGHAMRRHIRLLRRSGTYVAVRAAMLLHEGRARTWVKAHAQLEGEVKAVEPEASLVYEKVGNLTDALSSTYKVNRSEAIEQGARAFKQSHRREFEALSEGARQPGPED